MPHPPHNPSDASMRLQQSMAKCLTIGGVLGLAVGAFISMVLSRVQLFNPYIIILSVFVGVIVSFAWRYTPKIFQKLITTLFSYSVSSLLVLYPLVKVLDLVSINLAKAISFFHFNTNNIIIARSTIACIVLLCLTLFIYQHIRGTPAKIHQNFHPISIEEAEATIVPGMVTEWQMFKTNLQPQDEIWKWQTPDWTWDRFMGRCGYTIIRKGRTTNYSIVIGMN